MDKKQLERNIFSRNLKRYMNLKRVSQSDLSRDLNITSSTISDWVNAKKYPRMDKVQLLADYLNISKSDLVEECVQSNLTPITDSDFIKIPIYGAISCGTGGFNEDLIEDYFNVPQNMLRQNKGYFGMYAKGDSMIGENINDGDLLIFEKSQFINNKQIGCFCIDENTATCKVFQKTNDMIYLYPANNDYQPIPITIENTMFHIVGVLAFVLNNRLNDF